MIDHLLVGMHPLVPQKKRPQMNGPLILVGVGGIQYQEDGTDQFNYHYIILQLYAITGTYHID